MIELWNWSEVNPTLLNNANTGWLWYDKTPPLAIVGGNLHAAPMTADFNNVFRRVFSPIPVDCEIVTTMPMPKADPVSEMTTFPALSLRATSSGNVGHYRANISATGQLVIRRTAATTDTTLGSAPAPVGYTADSWFNVRFRAEGNRIKGKIWLAGMIEPTAWGVDVADSAYPSGRMGLQFWNQSRIYPHVVGPVGLATEGDTAPWNEQILTGRVVSDANPSQPLSRKVVAFERDTFAHQRTTTSDANGYFKMAMPTNRPCTVIVFDQNGGTKNAKIIDRVGGV